MPNPLMKAFSTRINYMLCLRCQGLMVHHSFMNLWDETDREHRDGWRCVGFGDLQHPIIWKNVARALRGASTNAPA